MMGAVVRVCRCSEPLGARSYESGIGAALSREYRYKDMAGEECARLGYFPTMGTSPEERFSLEYPNSR